MNRTLMTVASALIVLVGGLAPAAAADTRLSLSPVSGPVGTAVRASGCEWLTDAPVRILWSDEREVGRAVPRQDGCFDTVFLVPSGAALATHPVAATDGVDRAFAGFTVTRPDAGPSATAEPSAARAGSRVTVTGCGWWAGDPLVLTWSRTGVELARTRTLQDGCFRSNVVIPTDAALGPAGVRVTGESEFVEAAFEVTDVDAEVAAVRDLANASRVRPRVHFRSPTHTALSMQVTVPDAVDNDPVAMALWFVERWRGVFGLPDPRGTLFLADASDTKRDLHFGQQFDGIPVLGAEVDVTLADRTVTSVNARYLRERPATVAPRVTAFVAERAAARHLGEDRAPTTGPATLAWYAPELVVGVGDDTPRLVWRTHVQSNGFWEVAVDALTAEVLQAAPASRDAHSNYEIGTVNGEVYPYGGLSYDNCEPDENYEWWFHAHGPLAGAAPDAEGWDAFDMLTAVDGYFRAPPFGRSGHGNDNQEVMDLDVTLQDDNGMSAPNAQYSGFCDVFMFSDNWVADDIVAHEFTHGVTRTTGSDLLYQNESGALNESFSDVFAVLFTCDNQDPCDPDDWLVGEDVFANGARNVRNPDAAGDPDFYLGPNWIPPVQTPTFGNDYGGVHTNSGVPNKIAGLLIGGGVHRGYAVKKLERTKVEQLYYRLNQEWLGSTAAMFDAAWAMINHTHNMWHGIEPNDLGITGSDICQIQNAWASGTFLTEYADADCDGTPNTSEDDDDNDLTPDAEDNCPAVSNNQGDFDGDGMGDACDADLDGDTVNNHSDNCIYTPNADQANSYGGPAGDACSDSDGDSIKDATDNCVDVDNTDQSDIDLDGLGDACDEDDDEDSFLDDADNCPQVWNPSQQDTDFAMNDGIGDVCDNCPEHWNPGQADIDGDGQGDTCDPDDDGDTVLDGRDNCPKVANKNQIDLDGDGVGFVCDDDENQMLETARQQIATSAQPVRIPITGCLKCPDVIYPSELIRVVDVTVPFDDMRVRVTNQAGKTITQASGANQLTLQFQVASNYAYNAPAPPDVATPAQSPPYRGEAYFLEISASPQMEAERTYAVELGLRTRRPFNATPRITSLTVPLDPARVATPLHTSVRFDDPDEIDQHTVTWNWGDGTTSNGAVQAGGDATTFGGAHTYTAPGVYTVSVIVVDDQGAAATTTAGEYVVVYDPEGPFVTGGGWFESPPGAKAGSMTAIGRASFGFFSRYRPGTSKPEGRTEFSFKAGELALTSTSYDWLVVSGTRAQLKGVGELNGRPGHRFLVTAIDGAPDRVRIKITDPASNQVVYDNNTGLPDSADPATPLGGGSIVIHRR